MNNTELTDDLVFLMYSVRPGIDIPAYEKWLTEIDCPFFNSIDTIHYYANWKVIDGFYNLPFAMFDFMSFRSVADLNATWSNPTVLDFADNWEKQWGNEPSGANKAANYSVCHWKRVADGPRTGDFVTLTFDQGDGAVPDGATVWALEAATIGQAFAQRLMVRFFEDEAAARALGAELNTGVGTAITSP
ncbi:MAG: hypothetical protein HKO62_09985 [Gammaproteobacteria bacterium]|nr:hypothetical protein [Gammaproteobacteria bacterium]NNM01069.1 hypothetical protein [Gammaproteobacteria bacterium]